MTLTVYHLKTCDTCRKAIKALQTAGHDLTLVDVRADGVPERVLEKFVTELGWESVLNRRSTTWRGLSDDDKSGIDDAKAVKLLSAHPTLIKRPIISDGTNTTIGWAKDAQAVWL